MNLSPLAGYLARFVENGKNDFRVFIDLEGREPESCAFGFISVDPDKSSIRMILNVLPFDYPMLLSLLPRLKQSYARSVEFLQHYLLGIPMYYIPRIKVALQSIFPQLPDHHFSFRSPYPPPNSVSISSDFQSFFF